MRHRGLALAAALTTLAPLVAGCGGGGDEQASKPLPTTPPKLTVPGEAKTPTVEQTTRETTSTSTSTTTSTATAPAPTQTTAAPSAPATPQGGAAAPQTGTAPPQTGGATPDSPQNDTSPPANSPASRFEQFCDENPGAC
jgi:hypothetical protein